MKERMMLKLLLLIMGVFVSADLFAQQINVKGLVKDASGEPIIGANVVVKGTATGTITDFDGKFQLEAKKGSILVFSFVGYQPQEHPATANMTVTLKDDSKMLEDVVVIGYGQVKKNDATGAVAAIRPDEMTKGITTNPQDMLNGKVAGVSVISNDGTPGAGAQIRIRGGSSLKASNDPLIVIDGLAIDNDGIKGMPNGLSMVNPSDIETFTVLKDASATAIYGSRASNGVIIITTKKGSIGQGKPLNVSYNGYVSLSTTQKRYSVLNGDEYRAYAKQLWGDNLPSELGTANTDWQDEIFRTAVSTEHNVSLSGGILNMPFRVSLGYTSNNGIIKTSKFERYTASLNLSPSFLNGHLKMNINGKFMNGKNRYADMGAAIGGAMSLDPTRPVYGEGDIYKFTGGYWQNTISTSSFSDPTWNFTVNKNSPQNPLAALEMKEDKANSTDVLGNIDIDYTSYLIPELHLRANIGGDYAEGEQTTVVSPYSFSNNYYGWNGSNKEYKYNMSYNLYAQYIKTLGAHHFDLMAGGEEQHFHRNGFNEGMGWDPINKISKDEAKREQTAFATRNTLVSFFGRLNYSLLDKYLLTFTMRWDGSSRFSKDNRWGTFPSVALGWKIKEENFLKDSQALSDLKLRLGWGITGQQNIGQDFAYLPAYIISDNYAKYAFGNEYYNTLRPNAFNVDLKWEKTTTWNAGLDFGFLNNRIAGGVDTYYRETKDLLNDVKIPVGTNFNSNMLSNVGSLKNYGIEFNINAKPIVTNDFIWDLTYNVSWNHNKVTELVGGDDENYYVPFGETISRGNGNSVQAHKVGYATGSYYVYQQVYDENGKPLENVFVDRNGDGIVNSSDKYMYKKPAADVLMGLTSKFLYKDFDLSFTLRASLNNYVYYDFLCNRSNVSTAGLYTNAAYVNTTKEAIDLGFTGYGDYYMSDYFVRNASFLRCDNITLGYSFKDIFKEKTYSGIRGRLYFTAQNPFVITKYKGLDPEVKGGIDKNIYPRAVTFLLGLNLQF